MGGHLASISVELWYESQEKGFVGLRSGFSQPESSVLPSSIMLSETCRGFEECGEAASFKTGRRTGGIAWPPSCLRSLQSASYHKRGPKKASSLPTLLQQWTEYGFHQV